MTHPDPISRDTLGGFVMLLGNVVQLLANPMIAGTSVGPESTVARIARILKFGQSLLLRGDAGAEEMRTLNAQVQVLVDESRPPTEIEWQEWERRRMDVEDRTARVRESLE